METEQLNDSFKSKFAALVEKYNGLKAENARLAGENAELRQKLEEKDKELDNNRKEQKKFIWRYSKLLLKKKIKEILRIN